MRNMNEMKRKRLITLVLIVGLVAGVVSCGTIETFLFPTPTAMPPLEKPRPTDPDTLAVPLPIPPPQPIDQPRPLPMPRGDI